MPVIPSPTPIEPILAEYERLTAELKEAVRAFGLQTNNAELTFRETLEALARLQETQRARMALFDRLPFWVGVRVMEDEDFSRQGENEPQGKASVTGAA